jgi:hypothetical protein
MKARQREPGFFFGNNYNSQLPRLVRPSAKPNSHFPVSAQATLSQQVAPLRNETAKPSQGRLATNSIADEKIRDEQFEG